MQYERDSSESGNTSVIWQLRAGTDPKNGPAAFVIQNKEMKEDLLMENKFCYLKGIVDCDSGRIQDCNNKRTTTCPLEHEQPKPQKKSSKKRTQKEARKQQGFCFLNGLVDCNAGRIQDCNVKRVIKCPLDQ